MNGCIKFYCRNCKCTTEMKIIEIVGALGIYRLKCKTCQAEWRIPFNMLEDEITD